MIPVKLIGTKNFKGPLREGSLNSRKKIEEKYNFLRFHKLKALFMDGHISDM